MQSIVAVTCKVLKIFWVVLSKDWHTMVVKCRVI